MSTSTDISVLYREFTDSLTEVLAETAGTPVRRGRLARARAAVKRHPNYNEHEYFLAVEKAFTQWEAMQNVGTNTVKRRRMARRSFSRAIAFDFRSVSLDAAGIFAAPLKRPC